MILLLEYQGLDRAVALHDPALGTVCQVFDADGRVVSIGYPSGQSVHYGYSARGEVTSVRHPVGIDADAECTVAARPWE